jgi:predicted phage terminase large subunit-like protein
LEGLWLEGLYASYASSLSVDHSRKCKGLIESDWYQTRYKHLFKLSDNQNAKSSFENNKKGCLYATSVTGVATGKGGNFLVCDDPNNVVAGESETMRKKTNDWFNRGFSTRMNDPKNDVIIVVQQRLNQEDISGHILANDELDEWVKLILPMEYEKKSHSKTIILPTTGDKVWEDPRVEEGQLLAEERFSSKEIISLKQGLGSYGYAGQYQQRPSPEGGGIIKKAWFKWWKDTVPPQIDFVVQSFDTALTANEMSAYSACTTWGVFNDENNIPNLILLSMWRGRVEYPELREMAKRLYFDYRDTGKVRNPEFKGRSVNMCLVEAKASGDPLIQDLKRGGINAIAFVPDKYGDKIKRVHLTTPFIESGCVWLQAKSPLYNKLQPLHEEFLEEIACFPNASSRDLVDTMTQVILKLKEGYLSNKSDIIHPTYDQQYNVSKRVY